MDHDTGVSNPSANRPFADIVKARFARRALLAGGVAAAAAHFLAPADARARRGPRAGRKRLIGFEPVANRDASGAWPSVSDQYQFDVILPWGDPLVPGDPAFSYPPTPRAQARQLGIGHDGIAFFPLRRGRGRFSYPSNVHGLLCINHEFGDNQHLLGKDMPESLEDVRVSQHAHGVSVVEIAKLGGQWRSLPSRRARRIHVNTPVAFSGPVRHSPLLQTPARNRPRGTVNNCASGKTPWGTYLTCEENFNGYFAATGAWTPTEEQARYGFTPTGFGYGWAPFDGRFDLSNPEFRNEEHRFGWVVELDPRAPHKPPVKRTALGRFKHEGAEVVIGQGDRAVVYMGDDERFDYIYKFVSSKSYRSLLARNRSPLDEGRLYVARFNDDGTGEWLELTIEDPVLAARFSGQDEVLTYARLAADLLGATPMDRPEWISVAPDGSAYCTLTNNSQRTEAEVDAANPLAPNPHGHILRWRDSHHHVGTTFTWGVFLMAADTHDTESAFGSPDGLWADPDGRLFIQTDGSQPHGLNNQMLVADTHTGEVRRLLSGVVGDEITGIALTPDRRTMFVNVQHPGTGDPSQTNFPAPFDGVTIPRDATLVLTRKDGGIVGS